MAILLALRQCFPFLRRSTARCWGRRNNPARLPQSCADSRNSDIVRLSRKIHGDPPLHCYFLCMTCVCKISNLGSLRKLDVLDLHSNSIQGIEGLSSLQDLRVLNLAGNQIRCVFTENRDTSLPWTPLSLMFVDIRSVLRCCRFPTPWCISVDPFSLETPNRS